MKGHQCFGRQSCSHVCPLGKDATRTGNWAAESATVPAIAVVHKKQSAVNINKAQTTNVAARTLPIRRMIQTTWHHDMFSCISCQNQPQLETRPEPRSSRQCHGCPARRMAGQGGHWEMAMEAQYLWSFFLKSGQGLMSNLAFWVFHSWSYLGYEIVDLRGESRGIVENRGESRRIVESRGESWRIVENRGMVEGVCGESWGKPSRKPSRKLSGSLEI